ncbi:hypothetical protein [Myxococcus phage Mx1]|nr:hypothetical protein [Myxococcus phage Mx1]
MVGTAYLSKSLGVCEKQVQRYLASLKKEGRIGIETRNAQPGDGNWYRKRKITILKHFSQRTASEDPLAAVTTKLAEEAQQRAASYQELNSYYRA